MIFTLVLVPVLYVVVERRHGVVLRGVNTKRSIWVSLCRDRDSVGIAAMSPAVNTALIFATLGLALSITPQRVAAQRPAAPATTPSRMRLTIDDAVALAVKRVSHGHRECRLFPQSA